MSDEYIFSFPMNFDCKTLVNFTRVKTFAVSLLSKYMARLLMWTSSLIVLLTHVYKRSNFNEIKQNSNRIRTYVYNMTFDIIYVETTRSSIMYIIVLGISLVKKSENNGRSLEVDNSDVAENVIPENSADFGKQVDSMLYEKLSRFARSRSLQLSMPQMFDEGRDLDDGVYLTGNVTSAYTTLLTLFMASLNIMHCKS